MRIVIPTYRRVANQATFKFLPERWQKQTTFVADARDRGYLEAYHPGVEILEWEGGTIAQKRAFIIRHFSQQADDKIVMMDDDLRFSVRISPEGTLLRKSVTADLDEHLKLLDAVLDAYAHAGWSARQGNNHMESGWHAHARMCYVLGYRTRVLAEHCELGRIETREDMDYTLQLLRKGFDNRVSADIAVDQVTGFGSKGGCSEERTMERSNRDAQFLADLHPGFVRTVEKEYKASIPRVEVVCLWKKAWEAGVREHGTRLP